MDAKTTGPAPQAPTTQESNDQMLLELIDRRLSPDHLARIIEDFVDNRIDLTPLLKSYAGRGSKPVAPQRLLKLVFYQYMRNRNKPIGWMRDLNEDMSLMWLVRNLRVSLSTIYAFRKRLAPFLEEWNRQLLQLAREAGMPISTTASLDGSFLDANASRHRLLTLEQVEGRLKLIDRLLAHEPGLERPNWAPAADAGLLALQTRLEKIKAYLQRRHEENTNRRAGKRKKPEKIKAAPADPESMPGYNKKMVFRPVFNVQLLVDVTCMLVLCWDVNNSLSDSGQLQTMLKKNSGWVRRVLADASYPLGEDLAWCEQEDIEVYAPYQENDFTKTKRQGRAPRFFGKDKFVWNAERQSYQCPAGAEMIHHHTTTRQRNDGSKTPIKIYRPAGGECAGCLFRAQCTNAKAGRGVQRGEYQEQIERLQARMKTPEAKKLYKLRGQTVEPTFANALTNRGLEKLSSRGLPNAKTEAGIALLMHNLRIVAPHLRDAPAPLKEAA